MAVAGKKKILLVDDDAVVTHLYKDALQAGGYAVDVAADGEAAVEMLGSSSPDLVLLDMMLPKMPGLLVLRHIRSQPAFQTVPVLVLSNGFLSKMMDMARLAGANACIRKSDITPEQLVEMVGQNLSPNGIGGTSSATADPTTDQTDTQIFRKVAQATEASQMSDAPTPAAPAPAPQKPAAPPAAAPAPAAPAMAMRQPAPPPPPSAGFSVANAKNFQAEIRQAILAGTPEMLKNMRARLPASFKGNLPATWMPQFYELYRTIRSLTATVEVAGFTAILQLCTAMESLLQELLEQSDNANASTLRTVVRALETLEALFNHAATKETVDLKTGLVLVLDDDRICRSTAMAAVEMAKMRAVSVESPMTALTILAENDFDLIFSDIEMPQKNGFDFAKELRTFSNHRKTPVIFVTSLTDFETRAQMNFINDTDFIGKPVIMSELAVKALTYALKAQVSG